VLFLGGWLGANLQGVCETIKEVEQANYTGQLDQLTIVKVGLKLIPQCLIDVLRAGSHHFGKTQRRQLPLAEQVPVFVNMVKRIKQLFRNPQLLCQSSMRVHSVVAVINLRDAHSQQLF